MKFWPNPDSRLEAYEWTGDLSCLPLKWRERDMFVLADDGTLLVRTSHGLAECRIGDHVGEDEARGLYPIPKLVMAARWIPEDGS